MIIDTSFQLLNRDTVEVLAKENPNLLPTYHVNDSKDLTWNQQHIASILTDGILGGKGARDIAKDMERNTSMNRNSAMRATRTATTSAQNKGKIAAYERAMEKGVKGKMEWIATVDMRTRDTHALLDGEMVEVGEKFSNGCEYPGDPAGEPSEVYNCRCNTRFVVAGTEEYTGDRNMTYADGTSRIGDMSYEEWRQWHLERMEAKVLPDFPAFANLLYVDGITDSQFAESLANVKKNAAALWAENAIDYSSAEYAPRTAAYLDALAKKPIPSKAMMAEVDFVKEVGTNVSKFEEAFSRGLDALIKEGDFGIRIKPYSLMSVLDDGTFKNLFETGYSGGAEDMKLRRKVESYAMNVPSRKSKSFSDSDRPIYGMLFPSVSKDREIAETFIKDGAGRGYGRVTVILDKKKVVNNTTVSVGDSLDFYHTSSLISCEANNPKYSGAGHSLKDIYDVGMGDASVADYFSNGSRVFDSTGYIELQIHGAETHGADIIDRVIINASKDTTQRRIDETEWLIERLERHGVSYEVLR